MKFKKVLALLFAAAMMFAVTACEQKESEDNGGDDHIVEDDETELNDNEGDDGAHERPDLPNEHSHLDEYDWSKGLDENGYWIGLDALEFVDFSKSGYIGIEIPESVFEVDEFKVMRMKSQLEASPPEGVGKITNRAVENGDYVNIDYVGSIDGQEFDGGSTNGRGTVVQIGVTSYIDDFLDQLIGAEPGDTVNVEVTFPDDYHEPNLAGKEALFVTEINFIIDGEALEAAARTEALKESKHEFVSNYLRNSIDVDVPDWFFELQELLTLEYFNSEAATYNMTLEELLYDVYGFQDGVPAFLEERREYHKGTSRQHIILQAIAEEQKLILSDSETKEILAKAGLDDFEAAVEDYGMPFLKSAAMRSVIFDEIVAKAE